MTPTRPTPPPHWGIDLRELDRLAAALTAIDPVAARRLTALRPMLERDHAVLTFGGHFKSGKSTAVNAALARPLLPTDDLPETGVPCHIRAGARDAAVVISAADRTGAQIARAIACTTDAIRGEVALMTAAGERRHAALSHGVDRVEVTVGTNHVPPRACWVDAPGINDTDEMNACARRAAAAGDVLAWVLTTRQLIADTEVKFLSAHVETHGPASLQFIVNAFLADDTDEAWRRFAADKLPGDRKSVV